MVAASDLGTNDVARRFLKEALATGTIGVPSSSHVPVPLNIKAALLASEASYKRLSAADPELISHFKMTVWCAERFESTAANDMAFAERLAGLIARHKWLPLTSAAVGAVIDDSAKRSGRKGTLALAEDTLCDILAESNYSARQSGAKVIDAGDIQRVLAQRAGRRITEAPKSTVSS